MQINKFISILSIISFFFNLSFSQNKIDSLKNLIYEVPDTQKVTVMIKLASFLKDSVENEAFEYSEKSIEIAKQTDDNCLIALSMYEKANLFRDLYQYDEAVIFYIDVIEIVEKYNCQTILSEIYNSLGINYYYMAQYEKAIEYFIKHAEYNKKIGDSETYANALNNSGIICYYIEDYDRAVEYFSTAIEIFEKLNLMNKTYSAKANLGTIFYEEKKYNEALEYFNDCLKYRESEGTNFNSIAGLKHNIGLVYFDLEKYELSKQYFSEAQKLKEENGLQSQLAVTLVYLSSIYSVENKIDEAAKTIERAIELAEKYNDRQHLSDAFRTKYEIEKKRKNYEIAIDYLEKHKDLADSIFNYEKAQTIAEMQSKFDLEKKEAENQILKKEQEVQNEIIKNQKAIIWFSGVLVLLVLILAVVFFTGRLKQKKINKVLALKNTEILQKNEEIITQAEAISKMNFELQKLSIVASETDNAILLMDAEGNIQWGNDAFIRIYGFSIDEIIENFGKNIRNIRTTNNIKHHFDECITTKKSVSYESFLISKDNFKVWAQTTLTPILDEMGYVKSVVAIETDITKLKIAEQEIKNQNEEILAQRDELEIKNQRISMQNYQIRESIEAALRIQSGILPTKKMLEKYFDYFLIYRPKDIVSGDYYWFSDSHFKSEKILFFAVIDCTGHGVPGAFMSLISNSIINVLVNEKNILEPSEILENLDKQIQIALNQEENDSVDGLDIAICKFDFNENCTKLIFSGAKRPILIYLSENESIEKIGPTRRSIGGFFNQTKKTDFENKEIKVNENDIIYLYSDGFTDQSNPLRRSFGTTRLLKLLQNTVNLPPKEQFLKISESLDNWQNDSLQRDDITFAGIKLKKSCL